jgi:pilus assembly protein CpaD
MEFLQMTGFFLANAEGRRKAAIAGRPLLVASLLALTLAACASAGKIDRHVIVGSVPQDYRTTHPIAIEEGIATMDVPVGLNTAHLTPQAKGNIAGFAGQFAASGSAVIAIVTPSGSRNATVATWISYEIKDVLLAGGVDPKAIDMRVYPATAVENTAPIRIAYARVAAQTAGCGPWPDQSGRNPENRNYYNFGCASQQNLAALVDNPLDLLYPRGMTPADAARRAAVLEKYRKGDPIQGDYSRETGGVVAKGVGN